jgi:hypothetical protein
MNHYLHEKIKLFLLFIDDYINNIIIEINKPTTDYFERLHYRCIIFMYFFILYIMNNIYFIINIIYKYIKYFSNLNLYKS